jgi:ABC-type antimicrobial peptide transport system permease subunit
VYGNYNYEIFVQILVEGLILGIIAFLPGLVLAQFAAKNIWMVLISSSLFEITPHFALDISLDLALFTLISIIISILASFIFVTQRKLAEIIHEE